MVRTLTLRKRAASSRVNPLKILASRNCVLLIIERCADLYKDPLREAFAALCILCPKKAGDELFFDPIVFLQLPLERHIRWRSCSGRLIVEVRVAQAAATAELQ